MRELIDRQAALDAIKFAELGREYDEVEKVQIFNPWHRVDEPPKEEHRTYLVYTDTGYMCSCRWTNNVYGLGESDRWGWCLFDIPQFQEVVYWMPLPEPPKEDT